MDSTANSNNARTATGIIVLALFNDVYVFVNFYF